MANASVPTIVEATGENGQPRTRSYTITAADIAKGYVLTLSDPRTAAKVSDTNTLAGYAFAGIALAETTSASGVTRIAAAVGDCVIEGTCSGSVTIGRLVKSVGGNYFAEALSTDIYSGAIAGRALETGSADERINIALGEIV